MIIGKDRTNQPVSSSEDFDLKISQLESNVAECLTKTKLYIHYIGVYDGLNTHGVVVISGESLPYITNSTLSSFATAVKSDTSKVTYWFIDGNDENQYPLLELTYKGVGLTDASYIKEGVLTNITFDDTNNNNITDEVNVL